MIRPLLAALALLALPSPAMAQSEEEVRQRAEQVVQVLAGTAAYDEVFAPVFTAAVPPTQFAAINVQLTAQVGALVGLDSFTPGPGPGSGTIAIRYERAIVSGPLQLDSAAPYRIVGLRLNDFAPVNEAGLSALAQVQALPGVTSMLFARLDGSEVLAEHNADRQLATGSTFKLYVLSALSHAIARGEHRWDEVVTLDQRSFPSGQMQDWPRGTPVTLQTLATMMIAISDNTATDQLIAVLGRDAVEAEVLASGHANPTATLPFLTTRELFLLKLGEDSVLQTYGAGDLATRRGLLTGLQDRELNQADIQRVFGPGPRFIDIEWFASGHDLARVFARLIDDPVALAILSINLGTDRSHFSDWDYAGYKGGSEPGVLNFSWLLRDHAGAWWVLAMSWNDPATAVSELQLMGLAQAVLEEAQH